MQFKLKNPPEMLVGYGNKVAVLCGKFRKDPLNMNEVKDKRGFVKILLISHELPNLFRAPSITVTW